MDKRVEHLRDRACRLGVAAAWIALRRIRRKSLDDKFLQNVGGGGRTDSDERIFKKQFRSFTIFARIKEIGYPAGGEATDNGGVIRLPMSVVTFADYGIRDG